MADKWYFAREQIRNSPSVRDGIDSAKELGYRQQCANFVQDIGQRLAVSQLCINTSIVYMHRFYMFHSFKQFHRNTMAPCFIFLGAKVEEQPRKLEHVLKVAYRCLHKDSDAQLDVQSDEYMQMSQDLVDNESILLQTLGFDLSVEHPHTYVVKCAQMVKAAKELAQTSYFLATNSLHLTTFCIEQKPTVVACVCIFVACKWTSYEIPETHDKKHWWEYMDSNTTIAKIEEMSTYFIKILDSCPTRLKKKISTGPVIYKGGALQLKREDEDEASKPDKAIETSSTKVPDKGDGKVPAASSNSSRIGQSLEKLSHKHAKKPEQTHDMKKEHSHAPTSAHKHSKPKQGPKQGELDRKNIEHSKHHKHSSHQSKHPGERSKQTEEQSQKRPDMTRTDRSDNVKIPDAKATATSSRPSDVVSKPKVTQSEELSSAAKLIMSLPPLQHKHSLPDSDRLSSSESPAKRQKMETSPPKKPKPELDSIKVSMQSDGQIMGSSSTSHRKHKSHHSKEGMSSTDKHKMKIHTDKHVASHKHKQQTSEKSAHGQKHHSNVSSKHGKEKVTKSGHHKSSGVPGLEGTQRHSSKVKSESTASPFKMPDESARLSDGDTKLMPQKPLPSHKKPSSGEKRSHSGSKPSKNGHSKTTPVKKDALLNEPLLPPPPPPPSVEVSSFLNSPPPLPTGPPDQDQQRNPAPPSNPLSSQYGLTMQQSAQPGGLVQNQTHQGQLQQGVYSMHQQVLPQTPGLAPQSYQQQQQQQFAVTSANNYGIPQLYYQGQQDQSSGTETYGQPLNTTNMFTPSNMNVLAQPPRPPEGLVLQQIVGLPPPPPLTLPLSFPHPPT